MSDATSAQGQCRGNRNAILYIWQVGLSRKDIYPKGVVAGEMALGKLASWS